MSFYHPCQQYSQLCRCWVWVWIVYSQLACSHHHLNWMLSHQEVGLVLCGSDGRSEMHTSHLQHKTRPQRNRNKWTMQLTCGFPINIFPTLLWYSVASRICAQLLLPFSVPNLVSSSACTIHTQCNYVWNACISDPSSNHSSPPPPTHTHTRTHNSFIMMDSYTLLSQGAHFSEDVTVIK